MNNNKVVSMYSLFWCIKSGTSNLRVRLDNINTYWDDDNKALNIVFGDGVPLVVDGHTAEELDKVLNTLYMIKYI